MVDDQVNLVQKKRLAEGLGKGTDIKVNADETVGIFLRQLIKSLQGNLSCGRLRFQRVFKAMYSTSPSRYSGHTTT